MFLNFLNSLKTPQNQSLIESIQKGYNACFENDEDNWDWWERMSPKQKDAHIKKNKLIPKPPKKKRKITKKYPLLWSDAIKIVGKGQGIAKHAWPAVTAVYNNLMKKHNLLESVNIDDVFKHYTEAEQHGRDLVEYMKENLQTDNIRINVEFTFFDDTTYQIMCKSGKDGTLAIAYYHSTDGRMSFQKGTY